MEEGLSKGVKYTIEVNPEKEMSNDEKDFWKAMAKTIEEMGDEASAEFSHLQIAAHQLGCNSLRDFINAGKTKGIVSPFELKLEEKIDEARESWCKGHEIDSNDWIPNLLDNNTEDLKSIFKIEASWG